MSAAVGGEKDDPGDLTLTRDWVATWLRGPDGWRVLLLDTRGLGFWEGFRAPRN